MSCVPGFHAAVALQLISVRRRIKFVPGVQLTNQIHVIPVLRMRGAIPPSFHTFASPGA